MKKKGIIATVVVVLVVAGLTAAGLIYFGRMKNGSDYPEYFSHAVDLILAQEEQEEGNWPWVISDWWTDGEECIRYDYMNKVFTCTTDAGTYSFDLSGVLDGDDEWVWCFGGLFPDDNGTKYLLLYDFSYMDHLEEEWNLQPQLILVEFSADKPEEYTLTAYETDPSDFYWPNSCYLLEDKIYISSDAALASIDLKTGDMYFFSEEAETAAEYALEYFGEDYRTWYFNAVYEEDGVTVLSAMVSRANDESPTGAMFLAYEDGALVGYMTADYANVIFTGE